MRISGYHRAHQPARRASEANLPAGGERQPGAVRWQSRRGDKAGKSGGATLAKRQSAGRPHWLNL